MGRGRAKAKQVKVARQLKYGGGGTDLNQLAAELASARSSETPADETRAADYEDRYSSGDDDDVDEDLDDDLDDDLDED